MLMNKQFKAYTSTGNPNVNSRRYEMASSCALNVSCSFGQSARSIESRCVFTPISELIYSKVG